MRRLIACVCIVSLLTGCGAAAASAPLPTATPTQIPAALIVPLVTSTPTATSTPATMLVQLVTSTPTPTITPTFTPTFTPEPTLTHTPTATPTARPNATPTATFTPEPDYVATRVARGRSIGVPILMYHHIAVPPPNADGIRLDLSVPPQRFEEMMAYFAGKGFHSVKIGDVYDALYSNKPLPSNPIVFTFDDGYEDVYTNALPILQKYNFIGTFYIATGLLERPAYMTWAQVEALAKAGMDVESHSVTHPSLKAKPLNFLRTEIGESKKALEARLGTKVYFFCYPSGQYDAMTIQVLQEFGYLSATTTWGGAYENSEVPFEWPRVRVHGDDRVSDLVGRINLLMYGKQNP